MTNAEREEDALKMKGGRSHEEPGADSNGTDVLMMNYQYASVMPSTVTVGMACGNGDPSTIILWGEEE